MNNKLNILIIGKGSMIGSAFKKRFENKHNISEFDIQNKSIDELELESIDVVVHMAAIVHQTTKISEQVYYEVNSELPRKVYQECNKFGVKRLVFMSSIHVYGLENEMNAKLISIKDDTICNPISSYGKSKYKGEIYLQQESDKGVTQVSIVRSPLVIGEKPQGNLVLIKKLARLPFAPIYCKKNIRSVITLEDLISTIELECNNLDNKIKIVRPETEKVSTDVLLSKYLGVNNKIRLTAPMFIATLLSKISSKFSKIYGSLFYE